MWSRSICISWIIPQQSGIFNVGTGRAQTFNEVAVATINACASAAARSGSSWSRCDRKSLLEYTPFPAGLKEKYQSYTQADIGQLRRAGYTAPFLNVEQGVGRYVTWLLEN